MPSRDPLEVLKTVFGHAAFRGSQESVVRHVVGGGDAVVLFPTGAGKSLCYQVPALCRSGTAIVVSPLIALMRNQVEAMRQAGVRAAALHSGLDQAEARTVWLSLHAGELDLLYVTPERLAAPSFLDVLGTIEIALIAIDEAHCVSQWGHDFRPEYMQLAVLAERFPGVPRMALTATADPQTREDLIHRLALDTAAVFTAGFDRPNIRYAIIEKDAPRKQLFDFLSTQQGASGIVYCLSRAKVEDTAAWLSDQGIRALPYHAGLDRAVRDRNQDAFLSEEGLVLVATIAFGMGIDKPDVRFVAHLDLPGSIEAYYQETGRAGRDGLPAEAWMVYGMADLVQRRRMIDEKDAPADVKCVERGKLDALLGICETAGCRRQALLAHFGEFRAEPCGNCDTCQEPVETWDGTEAARKLLSAVYRTGQHYGAGHVIDVLRGETTEKVARARHDQLPTFGIGADLDQRMWQSVVRQLVASGLLVVDHAHGALVLGEMVRPVLRGEVRVELRRDRKSAGRRSAKQARARANAQAIGDADQPLFEALRAERARLARAQGVPAYVVFHDTTLRDMALARPRNRDALATVAGVGAAKLDRYGEAFLAVIREH